MLDYIHYRYIVTWNFLIETFYEVCDHTKAAIFFFFFGKKLIYITGLTSPFNAMLISIFFLKFYFLFEMVQYFYNVVYGR